MKQQQIEKIKQTSQRIMNGFLMGAMVGGTVGLIFGIATVSVTGPLRGKTYTQTVGQNILKMGGWFGCLMGVGSVIRGDYQGKFNNKRW